MSNEDSVQDLRKLASFLTDCATNANFDLKKEIAVCLKAASEIVQLRAELEYERFQHKHAVPAKDEVVNIDVSNAWNFQHDT
jgi:hypothetical protein